MSDIKLVKVYALNKNTITQIQIHRNKYTNTNTNTVVDRVKSGSVIVRESDVKEACKPEPATKKAPGSPLWKQMKSHIFIWSEKKMKHKLCIYKRSNEKQTDEKATRSLLLPAVAIKSEFNIYLLRGWFIKGSNPGLIVKQRKHGSQSEFGVKRRSSSGLRAFLRLSAYPPLHSGQGAALVWRSFP